MSQSAAVMVERMTKGGRRLFYKLEVIQQPERARACGSGPKCRSRTGRRMRQVSEQQEPN